MYGREEAQRADLSGKASIYELTFQWKRYNGHNSRKYDEGVLEGLQPHLNLKGLTIVGFPSWVMKMAVSVGGGSSLFPLDNLVSISLKCCTTCEEIPMLGQLRHLQDLELSEMDNVKCIGDLFYGHNDNESSSSGGGGGGGGQTTTLFPSLKRFRLYEMRNREEWSEAVMLGTDSAAGERMLLEAFPCLEKLTISECPKLTIAPSYFPCLKTLWIENVKSSSPLAKICSNLKSLTELQIQNVAELNCLPDGLLVNNKYLSRLDIWGCPMSTCIVPHMWGCVRFLRSLKIYNCWELRNLPDGLHTFSSLETLSVSYCNNLISFPDLQGLRSLSLLEIDNCKKLTCLPKGLGYLPCLNQLSIGPFSKELNYFPSLNGIQHLSVSLRYLKIYGRPHFNSLPEQLQHFTALTSIKLDGFGVEALPEWFGNLSSLEVLELQNCKKLKYLPTMEAMRRLTKLLRQLWISSCPLLAESCAQQSGPEWFKISHIPKILIDGRQVQFRDA